MVDQIKLDPVDDLTTLDCIETAVEMFYAEVPSLFRGGTLHGVRTSLDRIQVDANYIVIPNATVLVDNQEIIYFTLGRRYFPAVYAKPWAYARHFRKEDGSIVFYRDKFVQYTHSGTCFMPFHVADGNWYHMLLDNYARFGHFDVIPEGHEISVGIPNAPAAQADGVQSDRYLIHSIFAKGKQVLSLAQGLHSFDRIILPPLGNWSDYIFTKPVEFLSRTLRAALVKKAATHPLRVYVSRADIGVRNIINENEVAEELRKLGFLIICPGEYSIRVQIEIFAAAEIIAGVHGQGLTPILCADRCKALLEFEAADWKSTPFRSIAEIKGIPYYKLPCRLIKYRNYGRFDWLAEADVGSVIDLVRSVMA